MRWVLFIWLLAMTASAVKSAECPPNTFTCADGSCIPSDWKGDGEKDCEDGSDEESTGETTTEGKFDEVVSASTTSGTTSSDEDCDWGMQQRIDNCSEPIVSFLHQIERLNLRNMSFLTSSDIQSQIESGCSLMTNYQECVGNEKGCMPDEGVHSWREIEMFMCQLVLPSVKEHAACFKTSADSRCDASKTSSSSSLCGLVTSIQTATSCLEIIRPDACSSDAIEMLGPIREETEHIVSAIRCVLPEQPSSTTLIVDETTESTSASAEDEDDILTTNTSDSESTTTTTSEVENRPALTINMADAVNSLYYIYDICSANYSSDPFSGVAEKICAKQDEIAKWSDCYQKTLEKEKCAIRNATSKCEALISYNNNLDCAIVTMNDECEIDAQNLVVELQEEVNDLIIAGKCFEEKKEPEEEAPKTPKEGEFHLQSTLPKCTEEQENGALGCLVELVEINKKLTAFSNLNFLLEIASPNSTVVEGICSLFARYEQCLSVTVFKDSQRCSFASPLNSLARIGLAPICSLDSRPMLAKHRDCFQKLATEADEATNCQSALSSLSNTVQMMLNGVHGEALLCKSFYTIRDTFSCGERAVKNKCEEDALTDLMNLKTKMTSLGLEEGCPTDPPANLDEIIARPVARPTPVTMPPRAPTARPMAIPSAPTPPVSPSKCAVEEQKKFEECVKPLTSFQPHPLSVIAMPRDIDQACEAFHTFKACSAESNCHPLWARGMSAMFEYACNEANEQFKKVRKCIRETSMIEEVRSCVSDFSRGAPTAACMSSNRLHSCAIPQLQAKCGQDAAEWVSNYIIRFANAIDIRCKVGRQLPVGRVVGIGCSAEEESIIEHCAAPLNDIGSRVEELFAGGMQSLIKNINSLAPVFAGACNLTDEFRTCAHFLLEGRTSCIVSSCMIEAGRDICQLSDPAKAIDDNLSCLFGQAQEPKFAQCIRSTISTLKQFNLSTLRNVLPKFIDCTRDIVVDKCGESPIKIMKAMSTPDICPIRPHQTPIIPVNQPTRVTPDLGTVLSSSTTTSSSDSEATMSSEISEEATSPAPTTPTTSSESSEPTCGESALVDYLQCETHLDQFAFRPISIIGDALKWDQFCQMANQTYIPCVESLKCKYEPAASAQIALIDSICNREITLRDQKQHAMCLSEYTKTDAGIACISDFGKIDQLDKSAPAQMCDGINHVMRCSTNEIEKRCGFDAVLHVFSIHMHWANLFNASCIVESPEPSKETTSIDVNEVEPSRDQKPVVVTKDETTPATATTGMSNDVTESEETTTTSAPVQSSISFSVIFATIIPFFALL
ncbi:hypothetical protein GCK72_009324 [Caenorhabditis remanei]|uniref:DUF19 domain-containing protein n=1 Tax=Caenorhabditis remanei TaxID=31234 RepID=A0A6A5GZY2_CAERE|nr:hypothetical protein GCK72_009324 [Caenorhabditis remanei]KAF1761070.1 hypothetical protein GCK72_009324 [Caenorhabditis remanei]